jgi:hypothetical protein
MGVIKIAAVDSSVADKAAADVVCDGVNDQTDINTALGTGRTEVFLFNGNYQIDAPIDLPNGGILRGNSIAGVVLICNNTTAVLRSSTPGPLNIHEHVVVDSMRITAGTQNDLGCDFRGFIRSYFTRLRVSSFDLGAWFGGDLSTYASCWTNTLSEFYFTNNLVGIKLSGVNGGGLPTANNIALLRGEVLPADTAGAIAVDAVDADELIVDGCDFGYANSADGIILRANASSARIINSRFEWGAQSSGKYAVKILDGSQNHFLAGNIYTDGCSRPNVSVATPDTTRYLQLDAYARNAVADSGAPTVNDGDFFRLNAATETVMLGDGANLTLYSDAYTTRQLTVQGSNGALVPKSSLIATGSTPMATVGAAAGTGATTTIFGSDTTGIVRVDVGTAPTTGTLFTLTWATAKPSSLYAVVLTAASSNSVVAMQRLYVDQTGATATAVNVVATTALGASAFYKFYYHVIQY